MTPGVDPLVLLPGMGCTAALWSGLEVGVEVSDVVLEEASLDAEVERLLDLLPSRFALGGLSLGAIVAMALVRTAPERVSRLALLSTNPYGPTEQQRTSWADQRRVLQTGTARELQRSLLPALLSPTVIDARPEVEELVLAMADELGAERYDRQLQLQATRVDERPGLARIAVPTLVLAARDDRLCPLDRHAEIAQLIPGAELVVVEHAAHLSPLEQPAVVATHLRRWLARS